MGDFEPFAVVLGHTGIRLRVSSRLWMNSGVGLRYYTEA
jgi:hypothetical protein